MALATLNMTTSEVLCVRNAAGLDNSPMIILLTKSFFLSH